MPQRGQRLEEGMPGGSARSPHLLKYILETMPWLRFRGKIDGSNTKTADIHEPRRSVGIKRKRDRTPVLPLRSIVDRAHNVDPHERAQSDESIDPLTTPHNVVDLTNDEAASTLETARPKRRRLLSNRPSAGACITAKDGMEFDEDVLDLTQDLDNYIPHIPLPHLGHTPVLTAVLDLTQDEDNDRDPWEAHSSFWASDEVIDLTQDDKEEDTRNGNVDAEQSDVAERNDEETPAEPSADDMDEAMDVAETNVEQQIPDTASVGGDLEQRMDVAVASVASEIELQNDTIVYEEEEGLAEEAATIQPIPEMEEMEEIEEEEGLAEEAATTQPMPEMEEDEEEEGLAEEAATTQPIPEMEEVEDIYEAIAHSRFAELSQVYDGTDEEMLSAEEASPEPAEEVSAPHDSAEPETQPTIPQLKYPEIEESASETSQAMESSTGEGSSSPPKFKDSQTQTSPSRPVIPPSSSTPSHGTLLPQSPRLFSPPSLQPFAHLSPIPTHPQTPVATSALSSPFLSTPLTNQFVPSPLAGKFTNPSAGIRSTARNATKKDVFDFSVSPPRSSFRSRLNANQSGRFRQHIFESEAIMESQPLSLSLSLDSQVSGSGLGLGTQERNEVEQSVREISRFLEGDVDLFREIEAEDAKRVNGREEGEDDMEDAESG
ncbi:hypothetical protein HDU85_004840 [Gaertneriomyces sp. JEL0708]|nr:hypothetical protein HDU85_004840 [Gaertneriomyces sp. JEL0708]